MAQDIIARGLAGKAKRDLAHLSAGLPTRINVGPSPLLNSWFARARWGLMSHYSYGGSGYPQTVFADGSVPASLNALADAFDATRYAQACADFGVEYVVFTAWHYAMHALYPSAVMNTYVTGHASTRDVIADLIAALKPYGIRLILYVHPLDGKDMTTAEQAATGWSDATSSYATWNTFINALFQEMGLRYGEDIDGYWIDEAANPTWSTYYTTAQTATLRASMLAGNPARVLIGNRASDAQTPPTSLADYWTKEYNPAPSAVTDWVGAYNNVAALSTNNSAWWAVTPTGTNVFRSSAASFFRYVVLQAAVNNQQGGGIMLNGSPYAGSPTSLFEDGVEAGFKGIRALIDPVRESMTDVVPSAAYPLANTLTLGTLSTPGYVATRSGDFRYDYIHVLNPPSAGAALTITAPSDNTVFVAATNLATGRAAVLKPASSGAYSITLDPADSWDATDTVLKLERQQGFDEAVFLDALQFTTSSGVSFQSQGAGLRYPTWRFLTSTTGQQIQASFTVPQSWRAFDVDLYWLQSAGNGAATASLLVTVADCIAGGLLTGNDNQLVSGTVSRSTTTIDQLEVTKVGRAVRNLPNSIHHIRIVRGNDPGAQFDVLGVRLTRRI